ADPAQRRLTERPSKEPAGITGGLFSLQHERGANGWHLAVTSDFRGNPLSRPANSLKRNSFSAHRISSDDRDRCDPRRSREPGSPKGIIAAMRDASRPMTDSPSRPAAPREAAF